MGRNNPYRIKHHTTCADGDSLVFEVACDADRFLAACVRRRGRLALVFPSNADMSRANLAFVRDSINAYTRVKGLDGVCTA